ncbi:Transcription initiation protein spt3 [Dimargaris xerosporica]|nr:Transcription initiation protein spt3 [Dimargaris xerosporica]
MSKEKYDKARYKYVNEIQQMMFVFGEVSDPLVETANVIEDIVRSQVIEIIIMAAAVAQNRGGRFMTAEDLIFLIRHDKSKVARLKTYLSWKEVRKNVKDSGGGPEGGGDELLEETNADKPDKARKSKMKLCWEFVYGFPEALANESDDDDEELDEVDDSTVRLKRADEVTRAMTRAQYEHYSECRQASFTYRRGKRFREWSNMSTYIDMKPNEDIIDILGFLTFEMVSKLTETGLSIKEGQERDQRNLAHASNGQLPSTSDGIGNGGTNNGTKDGGATVGPFAPPPSGRTPLLPAHIQEAFRRMQRSNQPIKNFRGGLARSRVSLI